LITWRKRACIRNKSRALNILMQICRPTVSDVGLKLNFLFVSRRIDDITFERFVQDVKSLRALYTDSKMAEGMKTNAGNFSSRVNGAKRPGQDFVDRFYQVWTKELNNLKTTPNIDTKKRSHLQVIESTEATADLSERLQRLEDSISRLNTTVVTLMTQLMISNQKLIDAQLSIFSQSGRIRKTEPNT
jgi:hypothetical protein